MSIMGDECSTLTPISFSFIYQKQPSHTLHYTSNTCQKSYKKLHSVDVYITRSRRERLGYRKTSHQVESKIVGALIFFDVRNILLNFTTFLMKKSSASHYGKMLFQIDHRLVVWPNLLQIVVGNNSDGRRFDKIEITLQ